jgi:hypothetical protein
MKKNYTIVFAVIAALIVLCAFWGCDSGGDDDSGSPGNASDLTKIGTPGYPLDGNYELTGDIILPSNYTPIGTAAQPFTGTFDGKGHSITINSTTASSIAVKSFSSGVDISSAAGLEDFSDMFEDASSLTGGFIARGLFAYTENATIKNLNITVNTGSPFVISSTAPQQVQLFGTVAAAAVNTAFTNINISGGVLDVNAASSGFPVLGGIAGMLMKGSSVTDCTVDVKMRAVVDNTAGSNVGGVAGLNNDGSITGCSMVRDVEVSGGDGSDNMAGGLVGLQGGGIIETCYVSGNINAGSTTSSSVKAGGLAGQLQGYGSSAVIRESYSTGNINAVSVAGKARAGGIAGTNYNSGSGSGSEITDCYSTGTISASGADSIEAGGIAGHCNMEGPSSTGASLTIARCYASGNISITAGSGSHKYVGGIAGSAYKGYGTGSITACAALSGSVSYDNGTANRVVGYTDFSLNNNIAYKDMLVKGSTVSGTATDANGADKTSTELTNSATYTGWDFSTVWKMQGGRPVLKWQP